jgi:cytoplasmic iron level regulating protein YaaA (DUF328/UPF0246 family)
MGLMDISSDLAELNAARYQKWQIEPTLESVRPALFAFAGEVYVGLNAASFDESLWIQAQEKIRILSGLHGCLRPQDLLQPYRLEMGTAISIGRKKNLYEYWKETVTKSLKEEVGEGIVVNLASTEYAHVVDWKKFGAQQVVCQFLEMSKQGTYKPIQFFLKKARGLMARYILEVQAETVEDLKGFNVEGYRWSERDSSPGKLVFLRG